MTTPESRLRRAIGGARPMDVATRAWMRHNLYEIASTQIPAGKPATLEYFMGDYVVHREHHLAQIFGG